MKRIRAIIIIVTMLSMSAITSVRAQVSSSTVSAVGSWRPGDAHVHSSYSKDHIGVSIGDIAEDANSFGLDWIVITDHSYDMDAEKWQQARTECYVSGGAIGITCMCGEELSVDERDGDWPSDTGHYLSYGLTNFIPNSGTYAFPDEPNAQDAIDQVNSQGGVGFIAHPNTTAWDWKNFAVTGYGGIEVWNGGWDDPDRYAMELWDRLLVDGLTSGRHVIGIGDSDAHPAPWDTYTPPVWTYLYLPSLTPEAIVDAYKGGHAIFTNGPFLSFSIDGGMIGDTVEMVKGTTVTLDISWNTINTDYGQMDYVRIKKNTATGSYTYEVDVSGTSGNILWTDPVPFNEPCYYRLEGQSVRNRIWPIPDDKYQAYTNPIWVNRVHNLDLIFAVDVTGSMWDDIAAVKTSASEIVEAMSSKVTGYRIAVVSYRDFPVSPYGDYGDWTYKDVLGFSSDKMAIAAAIQSLYVGGGADWQESVYSALMHCIDSSSLGGWRTGADKFIILMGDAPPHDPEPFTGYTLSTVNTAAEEADPVSIWPISIGPDSTTYTYFSWLAEGTDGKVFTAETASEVPEAIIEAIEEIIDTAPPEITVVTPPSTDPPAALQDGVTLEATATDPSGVEWVTFSIREPDEEQGTIIDPMFESMPATQVDDDTWQIPGFNTNQPLLPDGYYLLIAGASDTLGNEGFVTVRFSIRNWASLELLPATQNSKAGRTMPVKFSIRVTASVDPTQPFILNEELTIMIYRKGYPGTILQTSTYGTTSKDYRIDPVGEKYITNFQTLKTPLTYIVEIYRKDLLIGSFEFKTVK